MQSLALDIKVLSDKNEEIEIRESIDDELETERTAEVKDLADADTVYNEGEGGFMEVDENGEAIQYDDYEDDEEEADINDEDFNPDQEFDDDLGFENEDYIGEDDDDLDF